MTKSERPGPETRRGQILHVATRLAIKYNYKNITRAQIANKIKVTETLISYYFNTMENLRRAIIQNAIENDILEIIAQGLAVHDPEVMKLPKEKKEKALKILLKL